MDLIPLKIPNDLLDDGATVETLDIIGVPENAEIRGGMKTAPGVWEVPSDKIENLALMVTASGGGQACLTFRAVGIENDGVTHVTNMASVQVDLPEPPPKPKTPTPKPTLKPEAGPETNPAPEPESKPKLAPEPESKPKLAPEPESKPKLAPELEFKPKLAPKPEFKPKLAPKPESKPKLAPQPESKPEPGSESESKSKPAPEPSSESKPGLELGAKPEPEPEREPEIKPEPEQKPEPRPQPDELTPGEARVPTGRIVVRLGGAPEYGDPLYRISVDGRQIANGNVDWALGLPALASGEEALVCWQEVSIPWDFALHMPSDVGIRYENDHTTNNDTVPNLIVEWINVDGVKIETRGAFANATQGFLPWPQRDDLRSWNGDLVFDVTGAFSGNSNHLKDQEDKGMSEQDQKEQASSAAHRRPLVIRVSEKDIANSTVMDEFRALRAFLRDEIDRQEHAGKLDAYARLGLEEAGWRDLVLLGPDGNAISLDPGQPPFVMRLTDADTTNSAVLNRLARLRAYLRSCDDAAPDPVLEAEFSDMGLAERGWRDLLVLDSVGKPVTLPPLSTGAASSKLDQVELIGEPAVEAPRKVADTLKEAFWAQVLKRGVDGMGNVMTRQEVEAALKDGGVEGAALQPMSKKEARHQVKAYYGDILKQALDRLQVSIDQDLPSELHPALDTPAGNEVSSRPTS